MTDYLGELRESARQVIADTGTPACEENTWPRIVELGWLLTCVPQEWEGLGLGIEGACTLHTQLGRGLAGAPFLPAMLALEAVCHSDLTATERAVPLARLTSGALCTAPLTEPALMLARDDARVEKLTGLASAIQSADRAQHVLVWTRTADCVALVALDHPGVEVIARPTWDITRRLFDLRFDSVALDMETVLARGPAARSLIARLQTLRDFSLAADSLGGAAALLEMTLDHLLTRKQFGRPLALFQALKHRCADLKTQLAGAEALLQHSLARVADRLGDDEAVSAGKKAKYLACSAFSAVAEESLQLHGGIGMAAEHPCHLFLKRAMLNEHLGSQARGSVGGYERDIAASFLDGVLA